MNIQLFFLIIGIALVIAFLIVIVLSILSSSTEKELIKMGNATIRAKHNIISNNKEMLKETADDTAYIYKDAVKTITHSVKDGLTSEETIFCKYCGEKVDANSNFCKKCGKEI